MAGHNNLDNWRNHQRFQRTHNLIMSLTGGVFVLIIVFWIAVGVLMFKSADHIAEHGLKDTVDRIWYGPEGDDETDEASQPD